MRNRFFFIVITIFCYSGLLNGQAPSVSSQSNSTSVLTFTPADNIKNRPQTRFREQYFGVVNGKDMELILSEKNYEDKIELTINLKDLKARQTFRGTKIVTKKVHQLDSLVLKSKEGREKIIESLFLHKYNPNFLNIITATGEVGYFFRGEEPIKNGFYAKPFISLDSYRGIYEGRIDGRLAEMKIETRGNGIQLVIEDKEQRQRYWTFVNQLPQGNLSFSVGPLRLKSTTSAKEIYIKNLVLDKDNTQVISGSFKVKKKEVGLFFIRKSGTEPSVLPEFPWPPPRPSDFVKFDFDSLKNINQLGDLDSLITHRLNKVGYHLRPNKYFYTPNGFALVTQIEQIDCEGKPLEESKRWNINISESEKDFNLIDYLRSLNSAKDGFYRIIAFVLTDDLNPLSKIEPTLEEIEDWLVFGSAILPDSLAQRKLTETHYCRIYVYEFNKKEGNIHAEMVQKEKNNCWQTGESHMKNIHFFDNLNY